MPREGTSSAPSYKVTVGSTELTQEQPKGLEQIVIEDHIDMVNMLTLKVGGAEGQPDWTFKVGDECTAKLGAGTDALFEGEIVALEPGFPLEGVSALTIRALDKTHRLGRGRVTRYFENKKDSDVVQQVGGECGLSVEVDSTDDVHPYILQRNESNIAFLKRLAARNNFMLTMSGGKLAFKKPSFGGEATKITMGSTLRSARFSFNSSDMVQKVVVLGWDIFEKKEIVGEWSAGNVTTIGGGKIGAKEAGEKFGESTAYVTDVPVSSQSMANRVAQAEMERLARQFCHGSATIQGDDKVVAGTMVEFEGLSGNLNGKYFVLASRHIVSGRTGYTTELTFCSNTYGS